MGVRVVTETGDFPVALVPVKRVGCGQRPIGVQAQRLQPSFPGGGFERSQHAARDAQSPGRRGRPDPLDFSRRFVDALEAAASDRFVIETGDHEQTGRRSHVFDAGGVVRGSVKAALETRLKFAEERLEATGLLGSVQGPQHRRREIVREPVIGRAFGASFARQAHTATAAVPIPFRHRAQPLLLQGLQQPAEIAAIELKLAAERPNLHAIVPDFEQKPRLRQRAATTQIIDLERANALRDQAVEATNVLQLALAHSLTLVRYQSISSLLWTHAPATNSRLALFSNAKKSCRRPKTPRRIL